MLNNKLLRTLLFIFISVAFSSYSFASMNNYCSVPPFITAEVIPNVLIILDNSNSMDEDFNGAAVGSGPVPGTPSATSYVNSRSEIARRAILNLINTYKDKMRIGLMAYKQRNLSRMELHNAYYYDSYDPDRYDPNFNFTGAASEDTDKKRYTTTLTFYDNSGSEQLYYNKALPFYGSSNQGTRFACVDSLDSTFYRVYKKKTGTDDYMGSDCTNHGYSKYAFSGSFYPTDDDIALGYHHFGNMAWNHIGKAWYSNDSTGKGYLHVAVDSSTNSHITTLQEKLATESFDTNSDTPIRNAGLTPLVGTLESAKQYFEGTLSSDEAASGVSRASPIQYRCQKNFVILVTDGLPTDGTISKVANKAQALRSTNYAINGKTYTFDVKTYVLGVALGDDEGKLDPVAVAGGTDVNGSAYYADNASELQKNLNIIFYNILKKTSSGTASSVLATSEKSGAVILQALFYPQKTFDANTKINWSGSLKNMWFYFGPFAQNIREDTQSDKVLNLYDDHIIEFFFDNSSNQTKVHVFEDTNGDGAPDTSLADKNLSQIKYLWEAGKTLWSTPDTQRKIFTDVDNLTNNTSKGNFIAGNKVTLKSYLGASSDTDAQNIINYIRGRDLNGYRNRTVTIGSTSHVWKLGDIIYSTPSIVSWSETNSYDKKPPYGYNDHTYKQFVNSSDYQNRGMVFVGANDGMLHAFRLGKVTMLNNGSKDIAELEKQPANVELGSEAWGFIPKNILPYLKYYMNPNYCHLYYVDLTPYIVDASVYDNSNQSNPYNNTANKTKTKNSWRTILIGGLNFGGACGDNVTDSVTPPSYSGKPAGLGRSSYFALDVTNPEDPKVLWEFTDDNLNFTTTGPAIIHIPYYSNVNGRQVIDNTKNGYWYVAFASGPDNYKGEIHKPLYLYVLNLTTGELVKKWQLSGSGKLLGNINAFAGRMFDSSVDTNLDYADDALYFGYSYKDNNDWKGGIIRLITKEDPNVNNWKLSKLIDGIGPIISGVKNLVDSKTNKLWLYFGEGRYFTKDDDPNTERVIYGVKDPCYNSTKTTQFNNRCSAVLVKTNLTDVTNNADETISESKDGWYINLDSSNGDYNAERLISDPAVTANGWVFYTTFEPTNDICGFGGNSSMWMVNYNNGGTPGYVEGEAYIQLSTGAIQKIDLKKEFGAGHGKKNGRKLSNTMTGGSFAPTPPLTLSPPTNKTIHWDEQ